MQVGKDVVSLGGVSDPKQLDCRHPQLHPRPFSLGRSFAGVDGYGGGYHSPRTPSEDGGETALLLPKIADNSGRSRDLPPSPSPMRSPVSSFPSPHRRRCTTPRAPPTSTHPPVFRLPFFPRSLRRHSTLNLLETKSSVKTSTRRCSITGGTSASLSGCTPATLPPRDRANVGAGSSGDENSDMESAIDDHLQWATRRSRGPVYSPASGNEMNKIEARLEQWTEARTLQLLRKLKKKEDEIVEWENLETMKARMRMREFEVKLEDKWDKAMEKMQRSILSAQKKAEKKKLKERASADRKVMEVVGAVEKRGGSTGKLPCKLICL
ncbi:unnamed protein product [Spirodela intermedia]|uniref:Remorin C-terminal domain-containing protein n=1 Tax=Spirodela intermedia TaxID=51605 RepID=A0A7I8J998_SPIIN|nr:unnamed protein product [Spirodela intermedia]CAA6666796.1 unnamed protein product [Spirodela intermedia]